MSTAVYYQQDNLGVEDYSKHSTSNPASVSHLLPLLARMMPVNQQYAYDALQQYQYQQQTSQAAPVTLALHHQPHSQSIQALAHHQSFNHQPHQTQGLSHQPQSADVAYGLLSSQYSSYSQALTDALQNTPNLYHLSVNTTPASSFNSNYIALNMMLTPHTMANSAGGYSGVGVEKCICKLNPNRIPRPRNAFILFRQKYHQSVLDEATEAKTNPEVSRELGRRWRALSPGERDHWNNLAEEEKKNHAKKYPNYRYTPRRNGKNKNCPVCHLKGARQGHAVQPQTHYLAQQDHQMMLLAQKLPLAQQQTIPGLMQQYQSQMGSQSPYSQQTHQQAQQVQHQAQQQVQQQLAQPANAYLSQQMGLYVYPYQQIASQFSYGDQMLLGLTPMLQYHSQQSFHQQQQAQQQAQQSAPQQNQNQLPQQQTLQQHLQGLLQQYAAPEALTGPYGAYDLAHGQQRFNSLPTPTTGNSYSGYEGFAMPSQPQQ
ncbi:CIC11C00000004575 [Sungouiella intermedia]|uniref:CIC11C00000004575 n=1 Tax=Sungouiella intermedia TaxID=45354 RepID=A0A1L0D8A1_9ASCO|nr:CIC11C00000004575 [[Candida] intermedia]